MGRRRGSKNKNHLNAYEKFRVGSAVTAGLLGGSALAVNHIRVAPKKLDRRIEKESTKHLSKLVEKYGRSNIPHESMKRHINADIKKSVIGAESLSKQAPRIILLGAAGGLVAGSVAGGLLYKHLKRQKEENNGA